MFFLSNFPPTTPCAPRLLPLPPPPSLSETLVSLPLDRIQEPDAHQLLHLSSGKPIFRGRLAAGDLLAENVKAKILDRHPGTRVGTDPIMRAARDVEGGLTGALERAGDLVAMEALYDKSGAEITIDRDQVGAGVQVVEATVGMCNNQDRSFHEKDSNLLTARVHRPARAAAPTSFAATPVYQKNANDGGCEQTIDKDGRHNCRPLEVYPGDMQEAAKRVERGVDEAVARDCPDAWVLVKHRFGNFDKRKDIDKNGKPMSGDPLSRGAKWERGRWRYSRLQAGTCVKERTAARLR